MQKDICLIRKIQIKMPCLSPIRHSVQQARIGRPTLSSLLLLTAGWLAPQTNQITTSPRYLPEMDDVGALSDQKFYYQVWYSEGSDCESQIGTFTGAIEQTEIYADYKVYFLQFGFNTHGYVPDPGNCVIDLALTPDMSKATGVMDPTANLHHLGGSPVSVDFTKDGGVPLGRQGTCDMPQKTEEVTNVALNEVLMLSFATFLSGQTAIRRFNTSVGNSYGNCNWTIYLHFDPKMVKFLGSQSSQFGQYGNLFGNIGQFGLFYQFTRLAFVSQEQTVTMNLESKLSFALQAPIDTFFAPYSYVLDDNPNQEAVSPLNSQHNTLVTLKYGGSGDPIWYVDPSLGSSVITGTYELKIEVYSDTDAAVQGDFTFWLTIYSCEETNITVEQIPDQSYASDGTSIQFYVVVSDSISWTYGEQDGISECGSHKRFELSPAPTISNWVEIGSSDGLLSILKKPELIGTTQTVTVQVAFPSYRDAAPGIMSFTVTFNAVTCDIATLSAPINPLPFSDSVYLTSALKETQYWNDITDLVSINTSGDCNAHFTYTFYQSLDGAVQVPIDLTVFTQVGGGIEWYTEDVTKTGVYEIYYELSDIDTTYTSPLALTVTIEDSSCQSVNGMTLTGNLDPIPLIVAYTGATYSQSSSGLFSVSPSHCLEKLDLTYTCQSPANGYSSCDYSSGAEPDPRTMTSFNAGALFFLGTDPDDTYYPEGGEYTFIITATVVGQPGTSAQGYQMIKTPCSMATEDLTWNVSPVDSVQKIVRKEYDASWVNNQAGQVVNKLWDQTTTPISFNGACSGINPETLIVSSQSLDMTDGTAQFNSAPITAPDYASSSIVILDLPAYQLQQMDWTVAFSNSYDLSWQLGHQVIYEDGYELLVQDTYTQMQATIDLSQSPAVTFEDPLFTDGAMTAIQLPYPGTPARTFYFQIVGHESELSSKYFEIVETSEQTTSIDLSLGLIPTNSLGSFELVICYSYMGTLSPSSPYTDYANLQDLCQVDYPFLVTNALGTCYTEGLFGLTVDQSLVALVEQDTATVLINSGAFQLLDLASLVQVSYDVPTCGALAFRLAGELQQHGLMELVSVSPQGVVTVDQITDPALVRPEPYSLTFEAYLSDLDPEGLHIKQLPLSLQLQVTEQTVALEVTEQTLNGIEGSLVREAPVANDVILPLYTCYFGETVTLSLGFADPLALARLEAFQGDLDASEAYAKEHSVMELAGLSVSVIQSDLNGLVSIEEAAAPDQGVGFAHLTMTLDGQAALLFEPIPQTIVEEGTQNESSSQHLSNTTDSGTVRHGDSEATQALNETQSSPDPPDSLRDPLTGSVVLEVSDKSPGGKSSSFTLNISFIDKQASVLLPATNETSTEALEEESSTQFTFEYTPENMVISENPPWPTLSKIDRYGKCVIQFNTTLVVQDSLLAQEYQPQGRRQLQQDSTQDTVLVEEDGGDTLALYGSPVTDFKPEYAWVHTGKVVILEQSLVPAPVISVRIELAGADEDQVELPTFKWECTKISATQIEVQLYFDEPLYVSANADSDTLIIQFNDQRLFVDSRQAMFPPQHVIRRLLPRQHQSAESGKRIEAATETLTQALQGVLTVHLTVHMCLNASINQLLSMVKGLQLILNEALFKIRLPADAGTFFGAMLQVVSFDPVDVGDQIMNFFALEQSEPFSINFETLGYETSYQIVNAGTLNFILAFAPFYLGFVSLAPRCSQRCCPKRNAYWTRLRINTYFNRILAFWDGIYLTMDIASFCNIQQYNKGVVPANSSLVVSYIWLSLLAIVPVTIVALIWRNFANLDSERCQGWFGITYIDLKTKSKAMLAYPSLYQLRIVLLAVSAVYMTNHPMMQLSTLTLLTMTIIFILGLSEPFKVARVNKYELAGEALTLFINNIFYVLMDRNLTIQAQGALGWSLIGSIAISILISATRLLAQAIRRTCRYCRKRKAKQASVKNRQKKNLVDAQEKASAVKLVLDLSLNDGGLGSEGVQENIRGGISDQGARKVITRQRITVEREQVAERDISGEGFVTEAIKTALPERKIDTRNIPIAEPIERLIRQQSSERSSFSLELSELEEELKQIQKYNQVEQANSAGNEKQSTMKESALKQVSDLYF